MKRAVITGGTGGLGTAIVREFIDAGWNVEAPSSADLDLRNPEAIRRYFAGKKIDLLVCAAGITRDAPLAKLAEADWDEVMAVNFTASRLCSEAVVPGMADRGAGHILFISSHSAIRPPPGQAAYAAAKAALLGLTEDLAARHGPANVRVNAVLPGFLDTRMTRDVSPARRSEVLAAHRLGRFNTAGRVAAFIRFLEEELPATSGQVFQLDSRKGIV